jgi:hypothetical protein
MIGEFHCQLKQVLTVQSQKEKIATVVGSKVPATYVIRDSFSSAGPACFFAFRLGLARKCHAAPRGRT